MKIKMRGKIMIFFFLFVVLPTAIAQGAFLWRIEESTIEEWLLIMDNLAGVEEAGLRYAIKTNAEMSAQIAGNSRLQMLLKKYQKENSGEIKDEIKKTLRSAEKSADKLEEIIIFDLEGNSAIFSWEESKYDKGDLEEGFFREIKKGIIMPDVFLNDEDKLILYAGSPVVLRGEPLGILVIFIDASSFVKTISKEGGIGETVEIIIVKKDEVGNAVFLNKARFQDPQTSRIIMPGYEKTSPVIQALSGNAGPFREYIDYRGEKVLGATRYEPTQETALVAKMDLDEALQYSRNSAQRSLVLTVMMTFVIFIMSGLVSSYLIEPIIGLTEKIKRISEGELETEIEPSLKKRDDELGELARAFERVLVSLKLALREKERENAGGAGKEKTNQSSKL